MTFSSHDRTFWGNGVKEKEDREESQSVTSFGGLPFGFDQRDDFADPRSRAFSDTFREPSAQSHSSNTARNRTHSLDEERTSILKEDFNASFESQARRLSSALLARRHTGRNANSTNNESPFAAISSSSSSGQSSDRAEAGAVDKDEKTGHLRDELLSPRTLTAANSIVAALRPAQTTTEVPLPTPPVTSTMINQDYYWGEGPEDDEVLWPSVSSADSLEDLF